MTPTAIPGLLVDLLGYVTGTMLYAMLIVMVCRERAADGQHFFAVRGRLPLITGLAGLVWNLGTLWALGGQLFANQAPRPLMVALAFAALGCLPAAVVHSLVVGRETAAGRTFSRFAVRSAYAVSTLAAALHLSAALTGHQVPSKAALWLMTVSFVGLMAMLLVVTRRQPIGRRGIWVAALAIFAISALHFGRHASNESWGVELIGHHAALPLALAILVQDYRFGFADLFLKNAIALLMLVGAAIVVFAAGVVPALKWQAITSLADPRAVVVLAGAWLLTSMIVMPLRQFAAHIVDRLVLRRPNFDTTLTDVARALDAAAGERDALDAIAAGIQSALMTAEVRRIDDPTRDAGQRAVLSGAALRTIMADPARVALVRLRTVEAPHHAFVVGPLGGGRGLLSDDVHLLEGMARLGSRRLDALRVAEERRTRDVREQQMQRFASEAELRALRAQINPHFLFNALTTVGHLIQTAPPKALDTLLRLTSVLRGVLHRSDVEFTTLGDEMTLIRAYLEIEQTRFEERLRVQFHVPASLASIRVPALLLQPIVENAVKHGIAQAKAGGRVLVRAARHAGSVTVTVIDTGAGFDRDRVSRLGVGLTSVSQRLSAHYGDAGGLMIRSREGGGTTVTIHWPAESEGRQIA